MVTAGLKQRVPGTHNVPALEQRQRLSGCPTGMEMKHAADVQIIRHQGPGVLPNGFLLEDWPVFQVFPGSLVTSTTPCSPLLAIVGNLRGCAMQHVGQSLLTPTLPPLRAPSFSVERFGYEPLCFSTVAPAAQRDTIETCGNR